MNNDNNLTKIALNIVTRRDSAVVTLTTIYALHSRTSSPNLMTHIIELCYHPSSSRFSSTVYSISETLSNFLHL